MLVSNPKIIKATVSKAGKVWLTLASVTLVEIGDGCGIVGKSSDGVGLLQAYGTEQVVNNGVTTTIPNQKHFKVGNTIAGDFVFGDFYEEFKNKDGQPFLHMVTPA